jgi:peroxiredoxin
MKKVLLFAASAILFFACNKSNQFVIKGKVIPSREGSVVLYGFEKGTPVPADTAQLKDGEFQFKGEVGIPDIRLIGMEGEQRFIGQIFVEKGTISASLYPDSLAANVVTGSKSHELYKKYEDEMVVFQKKESELRQRFSMAQMSGNQEEIDAVRFEYETINNNSNLYARNFIKEYSTSPVAAFVYLLHFYQQASIEELDSVLLVFDKNIPGSQFIEVIREHAEGIRATSIGAIAPDFTLNDPNGNPVSLSSLRGKYVLIDFWASWCQPCMAELPNVIAQYNAYKDKGFEIYGVSLDRDRTAWTSTIERFGMNWIHGWDLADDKQAEVANKYGVTGIPFMLLLDKEGKIIATNLRGEALKEKLAELMGEV